MAGGRTNWFPKIELTVFGGHYTNTRGRLSWRTFPILGDLSDECETTVVEKPPWTSVTHQPVVAWSLNTMIGPDSYSQEEEEEDL